MSWIVRSAGVGYYHNKSMYWLHKKLVEKLQSLDVKISQEARKVLSRALKPETKYVESLSSLGLEEFIQ